MRARVFHCDTGAEEVRWRISVTSFTSSLLPHSESGR